MIEAMRNLGIALVLLAGTLGCGGGGAGGGGGGWRSYPSPGTIGVTALWVFGPDDVWAGSQIVLHFDGASFTPVPTPPIGLVADFWGFAPDDLYAVSGASLLRWDGSSWSAVDFAGAIAPTDLQAIWGTSDDDLWLGDSLNGQVFHWNGTAWSSSITQTVEVTDLWGASQSAIYASGIFGLSRFGGSTWSDISDAVVSEAAGLWGFAGDDV